LTCILVKRNPTRDDKKNFLLDIEKLRKKIFVPIMIGGGISNVEDAKNYFLNGADKVMINSNIYSEKLMEEISANWGKQSISIMIDYLKNENQKDSKIMINCGTKFKILLSEFVDKYLIKLTYGEMILNSINNDGNGEGLDLDIINKIPNNLKSPILLMGGAGKPQHINEGLNLKKITGVVTANLFNFLGSGLEISRNKCLENGINLAKFQKSIIL